MNDKLERISLNLFRDFISAMIALFAMLLFHHFLNLAGVTIDTTFGAIVISLCHLFLIMGAIRIKMTFNNGSPVDDLLDEPAAHERLKIQEAYFKKYREEMEKRLKEARQ